jgi:hypothetical protein
MRSLALGAVLLAAACGGGGGGGGSPPVSTAVRLSAAPVALGTGTATAQLDLVLAANADAPTLVQFALVLPSAVAVAPNDALLPSQALPTLDGALKDGRYLVVCGDAQNRSAEPLRAGPLVGVRLVATSPRRPGTYTVLVQDLLAARSDGSPAVAATAPLAVRVTVE